MDDLVVARVPQFHGVPVIVAKESLPLVLGDEGGRVHGPTVADDETVPRARLPQLKEGVLDLHHRPKQVLLELDRCAPHNIISNETRKKKEELVLNRALLNGF